MALTPAAQVAHTIIAQLGGPRTLRMMIGAQLTALDANDGRLGGVLMQIPSHLPRPRCNRIQIELAPNDTYTVTLFDVRRSGGALNVKVVAKAEDVYCDMLREVVEDRTGLILRNPFKH